MTLATYYPFSRTPFFQEHLAHLPWPQAMGLSMVFLGMLLLSHIPYPVVPRIGFRTARGLVTTVVMAVSLFAAVTVPSHFFFPALVAYTVAGVTRSFALGLLDRLPERDPLLDKGDKEEDDEAGAEVRAVDYGDVAPRRTRRD